MSDQPLDAIRAGLLAAVEAAQRAPYDDALHRQLEAAANACDVVQLERDLVAAAASCGVLGVAVPDVLRRGLQALRHDGGRVVAQDGQAVDVEAWVTGLRGGAPHLFARATAEGEGELTPARRLEGSDHGMDNLTPLAPFSS